MEYALLAIAIILIIIITMILIDKNIGEKPNLARRTSLHISTYARSGNASPDRYRDYYSLRSLEPTCPRRTRIAC